jgi:ubiquinone biosynthesis monooxygenase Coq7
MRELSTLDRWIAGAEHALTTTLGPAPPAQSPYPAANAAATELDEAARRHAAGLMRINHAGEVCAQALYLGQAAVSRSTETREHLLSAAAEEADHLAWCAQRLEELGSQPSVLNPLWYAGSFVIGALAGLAGDRTSLGFIVETERQVEAHLNDHLSRLPEGDRRSRAVVERMRDDEARHADQARDAGGSVLPAPVPRLMAAAADLMKTLVYRL